MKFSTSFDTITEGKKQTPTLNPTFKKHNVLVLTHLPSALPGFSHRQTHSNEISALNAKREFSNQIIVFAEEIEYTNKFVSDCRISRRYLSIDKEGFTKEYSRRAQSGEILFFHELNVGECKFFIDFDKKVKGNNELGHAEYIYNEFKRELADWLPIYFNNLKEDAPPCFVSFLNGFVPQFTEKTSMSTKKFSVHFIISNLFFWNAANVGKFLMKFLVYLYESRKGKLFNELYKFIDWGVYKKHTLRIYYSHKKADQLINSLRRMDAFVGETRQTVFDEKFLDDSLLTNIPSGEIVYFCYDENLTDFVSNSSRDYLNLQKLHYIYRKIPIPKILETRINRLNDSKYVAKFGGTGWFDHQIILDSNILKIGESFLNGKLDQQLRRIKKKTRKYVCKKVKFFPKRNVVIWEMIGKYCFVRNKIHNQAPGKELLVDISSGKIRFKCPFNQKCKNQFGYNFHFDKTTLEMIKITENYLKTNC